MNGDRMYNDITDMLTNTMALPLLGLNKHNEFKQIHINNRPTECNIITEV